MFPVYSWSVCSYCFLVAIHNDYITSALAKKVCCNISFVNKLKPFYDAHYGPLKDKHHYRIGLTLLVRVILAITEVSLQDIDPKINILITGVLSVLLLSLVSSAYTKRYNAFFEGLMLINLSILCACYLYASDNQDLMTIFTGISASVALLTFVVILIVQGFIRLKGLCKPKAPRHYGRLDIIQEHVQPVAEEMNETLGFYREPLLDTEPDTY